MKKKKKKKKKLPLSSCCHFQSRWLRRTTRAFSGNLRESIELPLHIGCDLVREAIRGCSCHKGRGSAEGLVQLGDLHSFPLTIASSTIFSANNAHVPHASMLSGKGARIGARVLNLLRSGGPKSGEEEARAMERLSSLKEVRMEMSLARRYENMRPRRIGWRSSCQSDMALCSDLIRCLWRIK